MDNLNKRLNDFIVYLDKSVLSFEKECGLSPGSVSKMTGKSRPITFAKIANTFPQLNLDWLRTGEGEMLRPVAATVYGNNTTSGNVLSSVDNRQGSFIASSEKSAVGRDDAAREIALLKEQLSLSKEFIENLRERIAEKDERIAELKAQLGSK